MALLAVLMVSAGAVAGAPDLACASMAGCPVMQPAAAHCHGAPTVGCADAGSRAGSRVGASDGCCCAGEAPAVSLVPVEVTCPSFFEAALTPPPRDGFLAPSPLARPLDAMRSPPRPAGRDLLALHQTLLS